MSRPDGDDHAAILHALTQEVTAVAKLPGSLRRVAMHANEHSVEVEWAADDPPRTTTASPGQQPEEEERDDVVVVRAPLVGTFYTASQPGAAPFVSVGDTVVKGQTLAIVEAMKLMNPLLAECSGTVDEVLVGNGEPVEFDQPLIVMAPEDAPPEGDPPGAFR
ncbi:MAG TPA: biotin/lipoyl-containing protein [Amycolatopsis sp.]|jgi:acetyl-CoA carboxylase biotin carboxyl carrier protein|nr:biotin/lipoyl-containing protein [Amycolatopsis sp.]